MIPFVVVMVQFYSWIVSLEGVEKQKHCKVLGVIYTTLGTVCFMLRTLPFAIMGLILFMLGLRLIAHGLDRLNKSVFIDRFDGDK
jgi:Na+/phosphate symporter